MKITMVGTGYVGLVSGTCLAAWGHEVTCVDTDKQKIELLNAGKPTIYEPGLEALVAKGVSAGLLSFTNDLAVALKGSAVAFIAVGTPASKVDSAADISQVFGAAESIARNADSGTIVVLKSTVPVGTGDRVEKLINRIRPDCALPVVSNPEFLREGSAIEDFMRPDRIVIGTENATARRTMLQIYDQLFQRAVPAVVTQRRTSELIKYAANSFLATKITFINEMADLCERVGADIGDLSFGVGLDERVGSRFLNAGPGFGGSCFPKDTLALLKTAREHGVPLRIVEQAVLSNDARKIGIAAKVAEAMSEQLDGKTIAILGLSFKANTDDMRESPALPLISSLKEMGANLRAYDPAAMQQAARLLDGVVLCPDIRDCVAGAHAVVIVTEWNEFKNLDLPATRAAMAGDVMIDLRNIINVELAEHCGFRITNIGHSSGRGSSLAEDGVAAPTIETQKKNFLATLD